SQRDLLSDDPYEAALILHAESLVRAENQTATTTRTEQNGHHITSTTNDDMMDIINEYHRTDSFMSDIRSNIPVVDKLPELDLEGHYIDPQTSSDPEVQKHQAVASTPLCSAPTSSLNFFPDLIMMQHSYSNPVDPNQTLTHQQYPTKFTNYFREPDLLSQNSMLNHNFKCLYDQQCATDKEMLLYL
ncbi:unnamed protein product, partial [Didymodactylos carnosus]